MAFDSSLGALPSIAYQSSEPFLLATTSTKNIWQHQESLYARKSKEVLHLSDFDGAWSTSALYTAFSLIIFLIVSLTKTSEISRYF